MANRMDRFKLHYLFPEMRPFFGSVLSLHFGGRNANSGPAGGRSDEFDAGSLKGTFASKNASR
jgi:hypothetical protein